MQKRVIHQTDRLIVSICRLVGAEKPRDPKLRGTQRKHRGTSGNKTEVIWIEPN